MPLSYDADVAICCLFFSIQNALLTFWLFPLYTYFCDTLNAAFIFHQYIKKFYNETLIEDYGWTPDENFITVLYSLTVSIFAIGGMIGALLVSRLVTRYGRLVCVMDLGDILCACLR